MHKKRKKAKKEYQMTCKVTIKVGGGHSNMGAPIPELKKQIAEMLEGAGFKGNYNATLVTKMKGSSSTQGTISVTNMVAAGVTLSCHPSGQSNGKRFKIILSVPAGEEQEHFDKLLNSVKTEKKVLEVKTEVELREEIDRIDKKITETKTKQSSTITALNKVEAGLKQLHAEQAQKSVMLATYEEELGSLNRDKDECVFELELIKEKEEKQEAMDDLIVKMKSLGFSAEDIIARLSKK